MLSYAGSPIPLIVQFPSSKSALSTVGYTIKNSDGSVHTARATAGVVNLGHGAFGVNVTIATPWTGSVLWDTGEGSPLYAVEDINILINPATPSGGGTVSTTICIKSGGVPLDGVAVYVTTDAQGSNVVAGTMFTDAFGDVTFLLDAGTYYVWKNLAGYNFTNPQAITVTT